jgi:hypothetical protein
MSMEEICRFCMASRPEAKKIGSISPWGSRPLPYLSLRRPPGAGRFCRSRTGSPLCSTASPASSSACQVTDTDFARFALALEDAMARFSGSDARG